MYNQRRGLAPPVVSSDADARNANFTLMHNKRRQQLEAQLAEKMEMMKQFSNPRGIGMRGQTVPQRDIDLLQQQIAAIRQQLDAPQDGSQGPSLPHTPSNQAAAVTPGSSASTTHNVTRVQQQQPVAGSYPFPMAPSSCGSTGSRRDEVWQQKYEAWLRRNGGGHPVLSPTKQYGGGGSSCASVMSSAPSQYHAQAASPSTLPAMGMPPQAPPSQSAASSRSNGAPFQQYPQTGAYPIATTGQQGQFAYPQQQQQQQQAMYNAQRQPPAHHQQQVGGYPQHQQQQYQQQQQQQHQQQQQQYQQQQQQPVMFGRRATPPNSAARSNGPVDAPPQQAPVLGRRGQQVSQRPW